MLTAHLPSRLTHDTRGFTLIELLVATASALVVTAALYAIFYVSLHQSTRITAGVQADQLGRTAMTNIVDKLHSACLAYGFTPVQAGSDETKLIFIDGYGEEPEVKEATKHEIEWTGEHGNLVDKEYSSVGSPKWPTGSETPEFTFSKTSAAKIILASNVSQTAIKRGETTEQVPIFQYQKYAGESSSSGESGEKTLTELPAKEPLSSAGAKEAAAVIISYQAGRTDASLAESGNVDLSDQVTFAFDAPSSEATIDDKPCQ